MKNKKKSLIEYLDNRDAIIIGFSLIFVSFCLLITFYLIENPHAIKKDGNITYLPAKLHKWLFALAIIFALFGFILCEVYLIRIIHSLRSANNWKWQNKNKLQTIFITIPSISFGILVVFFFGSLFITGTTMSHYGYNSYTKAYLIAVYILTSISFVISLATFLPWIITPLFKKITSSIKINNH